MKTGICSIRAGRFRAALCLLLAVMMMLAAASAGMTVSADTAEEEEVEISVDTTGAKEGYSAVLYNSDNGLPTSEANAIAKTSEGFIWIGSYGGLIRYDGNTFERIDSTTGIASVVSLYVDSKDRLWIGTNDGGVFVREQNEYRGYNKTDGLKSLSIRDIVEDTKGDIYVATTHGMVCIDEEMNMINIDEPQINEEYIRDLRCDQDGLVYGVTMNGAIFTMKNRKLTGFYDGNKMNIGSIHTMMPDPENPGYIYIGTKDSEVYHGKLDNGLKDVTEYDVSPLEYITNLAFFHGSIWICSDNGIASLTDGKFEKVNGVPMDSSIEQIMIDYQGNLWFASSKQGVMKIVPNQFTDIFEYYQLSETVVNSTCLYKDQLFVGTKNNGLTVLGKYGKIASLPLTTAKTASGVDLGSDDLIQLLSGSKIRSLIRDSQDRIWISSFGSNPLICYDGLSVVAYGTDEGLPSERVRTVYERSDGTLLVACTGGLVIIKDGKVTEIYDESTGISNTEILTVIDAPNGDIILGTDGDGIYIISGHKVSHIGTDNGLQSDVVMRLKRSTVKDIYWIVMSNSIAYMDESYNVTTVHDFPYSNNFDMYENSAGEVWILGSSGIYVSTVDDLTSGESFEPVFYGRDNGLPCIATSNSYSELTDNGDLYIAGTTGVAKVNIETTFENISEVRMAVPYIQADGKYVFPDSSGDFHIPSSTKKLTIHSFVFNYSLINPQVTYYLDGFDHSSTTVKRSDLTAVDYTNLAGGTYTFVMEIKDPMEHGDKIMNVRIIKEKAMHEKLWFKLMRFVMAGLFIALLALLYIRYRMRKFKKKEEEQKLLIREIVEAFAKTIDMKDKYTNGHSTRVAEYTCMLTRELGYDEETVEKYYNIALLHDIGKIGIPPEVLNKPGKLTDTEFNIIKSHSALGYNALKDISIMPELSIGAGSHHERPDGKGYPKGLNGDEIPRVAQIIAVADTFDAMYSDRPYRKRMNFDKVVSILKEVSGTQLQGDVVDAFLRLVDKGEFRAPDDVGGGTTEDIDNIRKKFDEKEKHNTDKPAEDKSPANDDKKENGGTQA